MPITLRPVDSKDFPAWHRLWSGYLEFYQAKVPDAATQETWRRLLDPAEPMHATLAVQDGAAVGMVNYLTHRSTWTIGDYCYLQDLFVAPDIRGGGVGRRLIEHVYEFAAAAGCSRVHWLTQEGNATARLLYDRIADRPGFIQYRKLMTG